MTRKELLQRIWIDPKPCFGKPCARGHRIWVSMILDLLASGMSPEEILQDYLGLEPLDIQAASLMVRKWRTSDLRIFLWSRRVKLKLDENLGNAAVRILAHAGHDVATASKRFGPRKRLGHGFSVRRH